MFKRKRLFHGIILALTPGNPTKAFTEKYLVMTKLEKPFMAMVISIIGAMLDGCLVLICSHIHIIPMV